MRGKPDGQRPLFPNLRCLCSEHDNQVKENGYGIRRSKGVHRIVVDIRATDIRASRCRPVR
jgi:hypothetical protein